MSAALGSDYIAIVNGPEDGKEFPLVRSPFQIGYQPTCAVCIELDRSVQPVHAQVQAVAGGYSIRPLTASQVLVDGKKVGMYRSRTLRPGRRMQVGKTMFVLRCSRDGLARKSRGLSIESDFRWALRRLSVSLAQFATSAFLTVPRLLVQNWKLGLIVALIVAMGVSPSFRGSVIYYVQYAWNQLRQLL
jgi:hypothetical protein